MCRARSKNSKHVNERTRDGRTKDVDGVTWIPLKRFVRGKADHVGSTASGRAKIEAMLDFVRHVVGEPKNMMR